MEVEKKIDQSQYSKPIVPRLLYEVSFATDCLRCCNGGFVPEEKAINRAQYLDLVYSQYGTLYDLIPNSPHPSNNPSRSSMKSHVDGVVGSINTQSSSSSVGHHGSFDIPPTYPTMSVTTQSHPYPTQSSEVNVVQSSSSLQPQGKKKNMGKSTNSSNP